MTTEGQHSWYRSRLHLQRRSWKIGITEPNLGALKAASLFIRSFNSACGNCAGHNILADPMIGFRSVCGTSTETFTEASPEDSEIDAISMPYSNLKNGWNRYRENVKNEGSRNDL
jgi:hypothetical protein